MKFEVNLLEQKGQIKAEYLGLYDEGGSTMSIWITKTDKVSFSVRRHCDSTLTPVDLCPLISPNIQGRRG